MIETTNSAAIQRLIEAAAELGIPEETARALPGLAGVSTGPAAAAERKPFARDLDPVQEVYVLAVRSQFPANLPRSTRLDVQQAVGHAMMAAQRFAEAEGFEVLWMPHWSVSGVQVFTDEDFVPVSAAVADARRRRSERVERMDWANGGGSAAA